MFRRSAQACVIALFGTVMFAVAAPARAQVARASQNSQPSPCAAPLVLVGDLGIRGVQCTGCSMTGRQAQGLASFEFSTEPTLVGIAKGGPADGKLQEYDVLVALNGLLITTKGAAAIYSAPPPDKVVRVTVRREGVLKDYEIVPAPRCRAVGSSTLQSLIDAQRAKAAPGNRGWFGISLNGPPLTSYPEITNVVADSPAEKAGLKLGDMLVAMDGRSLKDLEVTTAFRDVKPGQKVLLSVIRDGEFLKLSVILGTQR